VNKITNPPLISLIAIGGYRSTDVENPRRGY
jgi:hypothetical protein